MENKLITNKHILLCYNLSLTGLGELYIKEWEYIKQHFAGIVFESEAEFKSHVIQPNTLIYLCGDIVDYLLDDNIKASKFYIVREFSKNYEGYHSISLGGIPINLYNTGVYFRDFFDSDKDYFNLLSGEHEYQDLTESNKEGKAFRKGIYLSKVDKLEDGEYKFNLLRCSSNLDGPTENFRTTDLSVVSSVNSIGKLFFEQDIELNHVLAQIYENQIIETGDKVMERKAKIKAHSDKTKDMPTNSLMAFCTFYKGYSKTGLAELDKVKRSNTDFFDYCYNDGSSVLTKLRFRLKTSVEDPSLNKLFDIILYPNSVFLMSLETNRLYTHEIIPSGLPIAKIPTRLGYVIRCSKTEAIYKDGTTFIVDCDNLVKMEDADIEGVQKLKDMYYRENTTTGVMDYGKFYFSLNLGDYKCPAI
jgi:hypothetical protein